MAGLVPAIHVFCISIEGQTSITGTSPVMTIKGDMPSPTRGEENARIC